MKNRKFEEVRSDYLELIKKYGHPQDMTGGFEDGYKLEKIMLNPNKTNSKKYMISVIQYGMENGNTYFSEIHNHIEIKSCELLTKIFEKYC